MLFSGRIRANSLYLVGKYRDYKFDDCYQNSKAVYLGNCIQENADDNSFMFQMLGAAMPDISASFASLF